jgi:hypothetical protein
MDEVEAIEKTFRRGSATLHRHFLKLATALSLHSHRQYGHRLRVNNHRDGRENFASSDSSLTSQDERSSYNSSGQYHSYQQNMQNYQQNLNRDTSSLRNVAAASGEELFNLNRTQFEDPEPNYNSDSGLWTARSQNKTRVHTSRFRLMKKSSLRLADTSFEDLDKSVSSGFRSARERRSRNAPERSERMRPLRPTHHGQNLNNNLNVNNTDYYPRSPNSSHNSSFAESPRMVKAPLTCRGRLESGSRDVEELLQTKTETLQSRSRAEKRVVIVVERAASPPCPEELKFRRGSGTLHTHFTKVRRAPSLSPRRMNRARAMNSEGVFNDNFREETMFDKNNSTERNGNVNRFYGTRRAHSLSRTHHSRYGDDSHGGRARGRDDGELDEEYASRSRHSRRDDFTYKTEQSSKTKEHLKEHSASRTTHHSRWNDRATANHSERTRRERSEERYGSGTHPSHWGDQEGTTYEHCGTKDGRERIEEDATTSSIKQNTRCERVETDQSGKRGDPGDDIEDKRRNSDTTSPRVHEIIHAPPTKQHRLKLRRASLKFSEPFITERVHPMPEEVLPDDLEFEKTYAKFRRGSDTMLEHFPFQVPKVPLLLFLT